MKIMINNLVTKIMINYLVAGGAHGTTNPFSTGPHHRAVLRFQILISLVISSSIVHCSRFKGP